MSTAIRCAPACCRSAPSAIKAITTIEGIGATPAGAKVQKAWLDLEVIQCGYCQSGQIMSAAALLAATPHPDDSDIDAAMAGQYLPLRHLRAYPRRDQARRERNADVGGDDHAFNENSRKSFD